MDYPGINGPYAGESVREQARNMSECRLLRDGDGQAGDDAGGFGKPTGRGISQRVRRCTKIVRDVQLERTREPVHVLDHAEPASGEVDEFQQARPRAPDQ